VAVVHPTVTDAELKTLNEGGIRGIRFTVFDPRSAAVSVDMIEPLAKRVAELGWHIQIHMRADQIVENAALLEGLPTQVVFDHMGRLPPPNPLDHQAFAIIRRMLDKDRAWVKLSGAYMDTNSSAPAYADKTPVARAYLTAAPERMVWGSDWPHPTEKPEHKPNDATLFDLLTQWAPDEAQRRRILVSNSETLYGFAKTAA
jgi:predicted TIM-barrel fold metal-dependent hydrolase